MNATQTTTEYVVTTLPDGTIRQSPASRWRNPLTVPVTIPLCVGTHVDPVFDDNGRRRRPDLTLEERTGVRTIVIPPGGEVLIEREFDRAIQDVHRGVVMGGLGPRLIRISGSTPAPASVHPGLDTPAPPPASPTATSATNERLMARARAARAVSK